MTGRVLALLALVVSCAFPAAAAADVVPVTSGSTVGGAATTLLPLTVPAGNDRFLAVGISTASNVTVSSVTFGAQALTREQQVTSGGVRSETWRIVAPNTGTANITVTLSAAAPIVVGATSFAGVDQFNPVIVSAFGNQDQTVSNSASFVTNGTVAKDGMFGTIAVSPAAQTGAITNQGSVDLVVADTRWSTASGTIRGAGSTRIGWTGANMSANSGIVWRWTNEGVVAPYAFTWLALKSTTGNTPPAVNTPTATNITQTTATLGGSLGSTGGQSITAKGVVYCQCADPVIGGAGVSQLNAATNDTTGPFTVNASGLTASRTYTYKAFASNALGTSYTSAATFNTLNQAPTANAGGPYTGSEDSSIALSGSGTDADGDPLTYSWDVNNDGTFGDLTGATPNLTRAVREQFGINDGFNGKTYPIRVRVSDGKDATTSAAVNLTLGDTVPDTTVSNGGAVNEGSTGTVAFGAVTDPSSVDTAAGFRYAYDFNNDGTNEIGGSTYATSVTATSATVPASFLNDGPGTRTIGMTVFDKDSGGHKYTTAITVNSVSPTATFASGVGSPIAENTQAAAVFSNQQDPSSADTAAGFRYAYDWDNNGAWDVGDGTYAGSSTASSMTIPAQYLRDGPASVTVHGAIIDKDGGVNEYRFTIVVNNTAPTATASNRTVQEGQTASVGLAAANDSPADVGSLRYIYDLDDNATDDTAGVTYANASTALTANVPAALTADGPATRTMRIRVIDKDGGSNVYTETVTVTNVAPTGTLANRTVDEGTAISIGLTGVADPGDLATVRYAYDVNNDGVDDTAVTYANATTATTFPVPPALTADGPATFVVRVRVIDKDGGFTAYNATITVANVKPTAKLADVTVDEGKVATIGATDVVDPADAATVHYVYDVDGNATDDTVGVAYAEGVTATTAQVPANLTADGPATVPVHVRVVDKDGGSNVYTADVHVENVIPTATLADVTTVEGTDATVAFTGADDVSAADKAAGFTFEWDVDGDGKFTPGTGSVVVPAPDGPDSKTIAGAIIDKDGGRHAYTAKLTVTNAAPTAKLTGPDAVGSAGDVTVGIEVADVGADTLTSVLDWGDGTTQTITGTDTKSADHKYASAGEKTITLVATDSDGAKSAVATHTVSVAAAPAAPAPPTTVTPESAKQAITGVKITPRCLRADDLRAKIAKQQTMKVRFSLATAAPVKFTLQRLSGKGGASKCPPARGVKHPDGKRVPGVYRPFTNKSVNVGKGANTVTVAATGKKGRRLAPGTYLLIIESGGVSARTKLWVLAG
ncbi:beta strand repeat-containing protein [Solirubrobacter soli]|uniref:beta strand repeat-containing protein n=1 Tax=Solirubrobacter soli TaxID=363832 RepID=UPI00041822AA|nr:PKD domain-containing protein [Solirubrobacter soli]